MKKHIQHLTIIILLLLIPLLLWIHRGRNNEETNIPSVLLVGTAADFPPFSFTQNDAIVGFDIDVVESVAKKLGTKIMIKNIPFEALIPQLQLDKINLIAAGMSVTDERQSRINFSHPYLTDSPLVLLTLKEAMPWIKTSDLPWNAPLTLQGKRIVVNSGYIAEQFSAAMGDAWQKGLKRVPTIGDAIQILLQKQADVFVTELHTIKPILAAHEQDKFDFFVIPESNSPIALGIGKDHPSLLKEVNQALEMLEQEGTMEQLRKKWGLTS